MKWYYWVAIAVAVYYFFFRKPAAAASNTLPASASTALTSAVKGAPAAYDTNPANYHPATDQAAYPGFYQSSVDGSWYNPTTGDFYSAGSSPPAVVYPTFDTFTIDLNPPVPANAATPAPGEIIY